MSIVGLRAVGLLFDKLSKDRKYKGRLPAFPNFESCLNPSGDTVPGACTYTEIVYNTYVLSNRPYVVLHVANYRIRGSCYMLIKVYLVPKEFSRQRVPAGRVEFLADGPVVRRLFTPILLPDNLRGNFEMLDEHNGSLFGFFSSIDIELNECLKQAGQE